MNRLCFSGFPATLVATTLHGMGEVTGNNNTRAILIVEDHVPLVSAYSRALSGQWSLRACRTLGEAKRAIRNLDIELVAGVFDIGLPDGSGIDALAVFRDYYPASPAIVLSGACEAELINEAHRFGAEYAVKPLCLRNLVAFVDRVGDGHTASERSVRLGEFSRRHCLSPREQLVLEQAAGGVPRRRIAEALGVSENTVKSQVKSLLTKTGHRRLSDAVLDLRLVH